MGVFNEYFTRKYISSKGALFNLILSDRSDGKTTNIKTETLDDYVNNGWTGVLLRRYKTEITQKMYSTFMNDIVNVKGYEDTFEKYDFRSSKIGIEIAKKGTKDFHWLIYFMPLTMTTKLKSQIDVNNIHVISYDEFVPMDNKYLPNEITLILDFWKSIDRDRLTTKLFITGNKIDLFNPVFDYFNIDLNIKADNVIRTYRNGSLAVQIYSSKEHRELRKNSKFNDLIKGTEYESYDLGGILFENKIRQASIQNCDFLTSFKTELGEGSIWKTKNNEFVISEKKRKDGAIWVDKIYHSERQEIVVNYGLIPQTLKRMYRTNKLYYETPKALYIFQNIIKKSSAL